MPVVFSILLIIYRIYLLLRYCSQYLDGDQALMWYGTAVFGHLKFPEPCFFGQAYGSMIESLIAVPLYWIRVPFQFALPAATIFLSIVPFFYLSYKAYRKGNIKISLLILLCYIAMSWQWDILTSVPRALIGGLRNVLPAAGGFICGILLQKLVKAFYLKKCGLCITP